MHLIYRDEWDERLTKVIRSIRLMPKIILVAAIVFIIALPMNPVPINQFAITVILYSIKLTSSEWPMSMDYPSFARGDP